MSYQVGELSWPKNDDPAYEREEDAFTEASRRSDNAATPAIGVWQDGVVLVAIAYDGLVFCR